MGVNKNTAAYYYLRLRELIWTATEDSTPFCGEVEVDEGYFGGQRKGKRGRGAAGKVPVFGLLKRGGKVYTRIIPDARSVTLMPILKEKIPDFTQPAEAKKEEVFSPRETSPGPATDSAQNPTA